MQETPKKSLQETPKKSLQKTPKKNLQETPKKSLQKTPAANILKARYRFDLLLQDTDDPEKTIPIRVEGSLAQELLGPFSSSLNQFKFR